MRSMQKVRRPTSSCSNSSLRLGHTARTCSEEQSRKRPITRTHEVTDQRRRLYETSVYHYRDSRGARRRERASGARGVESRHDHRGSRGAHERSRRRQSAGRCPWQGLSGSAFRRAEAKLHPPGQPRRPADRSSAASWKSAGCRRSSTAAGMRRFSPARMAISTRRSTSRFSRFRPGRSPARWATCIRWQPALLARPGQRPPDRAGDSRQAERAVAGGQGVLRPALRRLRQASRRGREEDGTRRWRRTKARRSSPITARGRTSWSGSAWTSSATSNRSRAFPRRPRTRSSSIADMKTPGRQADRRRAVLRFEDAAGHRQPGRRQGAGAGAVGRRDEGSHRLHPAVRLRRQHCLRRRSSKSRESRRTWTGRSCSFWRRRSPPA